MNKKEPKLRLFFGKWIGKGRAVVTLPFAWNDYQMIYRTVIFESERSPMNALLHCVARTQSFLRSFVDLRSIQLLLSTPPFKK